MDDTDWNDLALGYPRPQYGRGKQPEENLVPAVLALRDDLQGIGSSLDGKDITPLSIATVSGTFTSADNSASTNIVQVLANNLTAGVGIGFNEIRVIGSNASGSLYLTSKGTFATTYIGNDVDGHVRFALVDALRNNIYFGNNSFGITADSGNKIHLSKTSTPAVGITVDTATGFLGVNTPTPTSALHSVGDAQITGTIVGGVAGTGNGFLRLHNASNGSAEANIYNTGAGQLTMDTGANAYPISLAGSKVVIASILQVSSCIVSTLPAAIAGGVIYVTDESGGAVLATSDGSTWKRAGTQTTIS